MSQDQMQDIFPIDFDFVKGEMPTAAKLTGWIKQTNAGFSRITRAVGDPWEANTDNHLFPLSPGGRLTQASLARIVGPADYISPDGACWNEKTPDGLVITLNKNRNSWSLGFPLVKVDSPLEPNSMIDKTTKLVWGTDINETTTSGIFSGTPKDSLEELAADGDFYIDHYKGIITTYTSSTSNVELSVDNIHLFGPGVPWGTSNVIPHWKQTDSYCSIATGTAGHPSSTVYILDLPTVSTGNVISGGNLKGAVVPADPDGTFPHEVNYLGTNVAGKGASYRLPHSLTDNATDEDEIPDGFMYLWSDSADRILSQITFKYRDEYSVYLITPDDWLEPRTNDYRLILTGTSLAESVAYLIKTVRDNRHVGLTDGQNSRSMAYTAPISHNYLSDLYTGSLPSTLDEDDDYDITQFQFSKSNYPTNPHSQYLHRAGWLPGDEENNDGNAMRGNIVFSQQETFAVSSGSNAYDTKTYGVYFGGFGGIAANLAFRGGKETEYLGTVAATKYAFGLPTVGLHDNSIDPENSVYGALTCNLYEGTPLLLRAGNGIGASLAFDLGAKSEMNYIQLKEAVDRDTTEDVPNIPAKTTTILPGSGGFDAPLGITPSLVNRLSHKQIREFRFRGVSRVTDSLNDSDLALNTDNEAEFNNHFTSPGVVGADFFNVYSNAIFFSDLGDGTTTSLTTKGEDWFNTSSATTSGNWPIGIYYEPKLDLSVDNSGKFSFVVGSGTDTDTDLVTEFGYHKILMQPNSFFDVSTERITMTASETSTGTGFSVSYGSQEVIVAESNGINGNHVMMKYDSASNDDNYIKVSTAAGIDAISIRGSEQVSMSAVEDLSLTADGSISAVYYNRCGFYAETNGLTTYARLAYGSESYISAQVSPAGHSASVYSSGTVNIQSGGDVAITAGGSIILSGIIDINTGIFNAGEVGTPITTIGLYSNSINIIQSGIGTLSINNTLGDTLVQANNELTLHSKDNSTLSAVDDIFIRPDTNNGGSGDVRFVLSQAGNGRNIVLLENDGVTIGLRNNTTGLPKGALYEDGSGVVMIKLT